MAVYQLNSGAPESASFTLAEASDVNISLLGDSVTQSKSEVILELDKGSSEFAPYNVKVSQTTPLIAVKLKANTYRLRLTNPDGAGDYNVAVSPNS